MLYLVSPLDISPDVFPVLGWIDDGIVVSLLISEVSQLMTEQLKRKHFSASSRSEADFNEGVETDSGKTITVEAVQVI
ncbi:MAG: YkvA family protein [Phormidesmis sp.]